METRVVTSMCGALGISLSLPPALFVPRAALKGCFEPWGACPIYFVYARAGDDDGDEQLPKPSSAFCTRGMWDGAWLSFSLFFFFSDLLRWLKEWLFFGFIFPMLAGVLSCALTFLRLFLWRFRVRTVTRNEQFINRLLVLRVSIIGIQLSKAVWVLRDGL